jgi:hypothetical protein
VALSGLTLPHITRAEIRAALRQALMTATAAWFSYETTTWVGSADPYWAAVSAIVVMQSDLIGIRNSARDRLVGTAIGAVTGWACAAGWQDHTSIYALAIGGCVMLCGLLNLGAAGRLSAVTLTVIVLIPRHEPIWKIAVFRFLQVSWGIAVAVGVAELVARVEPRWFSPAANPSAPAPPLPVMPVPLTPVPVTPVPVTPVPLTPVPLTPVPLTPVPLTPVPLTPVPLTPVPVTPVPLTPVPLTAPLDAPASPAPTRPAVDAGRGNPAWPPSP